MAADWKEFLEGLGKEGAAQLKKEIVDWFGSMQTESDEFLKKQKTKTERYLTQLATGEITLDQFKSYTVAIKELTELEMLSMAVAAKARAQKFVDKLKDLILDRLISLVV